MEKIRINFWVDESLYYAIKGKLLDHKRATRERITITDICTKALQDYIDNPKEGEEMKNKTYAVLANDGWEAGNQFDTVTNYPPYNGWIIVGDITEEELEADDDVIEYREVEVIDPGKAKKSDYFPQDDVMGNAIRF
jgi:hypothetical protein